MLWHELPIVSLKTPQSAWSALCFVGECLIVLAWFVFILIVLPLLVQRG